MRTKVSVFFPTSQISEKNLRTLPPRAQPIPRPAFPPRPRGRHTVVSDRLSPCSCAPKCPSAPLCGERVCSPRPHLGQAKDEPVRGATPASLTSEYVGPRVPPMSALPSRCTLPSPLQRRPSYRAAVAGWPPSASTAASSTRHARSPTSHWARPARVVRAGSEPSGSDRGVPRQPWLWYSDLAMVRADESLVGQDREFDREAAVAVGSAESRRRDDGPRAGTGCASCGSRKGLGDLGSTDVARQRSSCRCPSI